MSDPSSPGADTTALMLGALAGTAVVVALVLAARRVCGQRLHACMRPLCPQFADAFIKCGTNTHIPETHTVWKYPSFSRVHLQCLVLFFWNFERVNVNGVSIRVFIRLVSLVSI